ncbi:hypothetical protein TNCV_3777211 [Trichonephila clavipes]|nr:hypothetical protein TNCV_3777211 [Trichonephila clavipes]
MSVDFLTCHDPIGEQSLKFHSCTNFQHFSEQFSSKRFAQPIRMQKPSSMTNSYSSLHLLEMGLMAVVAKWSKSQTQG